MVGPMARLLRISEIMQQMQTQASAKSHYTMNNAVNA